MTLNQNELNRIYLLALQLNNSEALNGDDIEDINKALKLFNGDDDNVI